MLTGLQLDELIARGTGTDRQVALADALGSVLARTDASQQVTASWAYSPYGETVAIGPSLEQPNQYVTREHDEGPGMKPGKAQMLTVAATEPAATCCASDGYFAKIES